MISALFTSSSMESLRRPRSPALATHLADSSAALYRERRAIASQPRSARSPMPCHCRQEPLGLCPWRMFHVVPLISFLNFPWNRSACSAHDSPKQGARSNLFSRLGRYLCYHANRASDLRASEFAAKLDCPPMPSRSPSIARASCGILLPSACDTGLA